MMIGLADFWPGLHIDHNTTASRLFYYHKAMIRDIKKGQKGNPLNALKPRR
jgi:hypothetical protein